MALASSSWSIVFMERHGMQGWLQEGSWEQP